MATEIQIRGVSPEIKTQLKRRAAEEGLSLSQYLLRLLESDLALPTPRELSERIGGRAPVDIAGWRVTRLRHTGLVAAAFELRMNYSAYDALYVAVAQRFGARLITCDSQLSRAPAVAGLEIEVVA